MARAISKISPPPCCACATSRSVCPPNGCLGNKKSNICTSGDFVFSRFLPTTPIQSSCVSQKKQGDNLFSMRCLERGVHENRHHKKLNLTAMTRIASVGMDNGTSSALNWHRRRRAQSESTVSLFRGSRLYQASCPSPPG